MSIVEELCGDLAAEHRSLDAVLDSLGPRDWARHTPAAGWDVRDTVGHLCFFEEAAVVAVAEPSRFEVWRSGLVEEMAGAAQEGRDRPDEMLARSCEGEALVRRWRQARQAFLDAVVDTDRKAVQSGTRPRVPWFGPAMSPASFATARILEAWAHGVDIRDALGLPLEETSRLRHVCHLGFSARGYSFAAHGVEDPGEPVRLEVAAPDGTGWEWGAAGAGQRITGPALDVALVFAQRRHPSRTRVRADGPAASLWLSIAQAFAGPPTVTAADR